MSDLNRLTPTQQERLIEALYFAILYRGDIEKKQGFDTDSCMLATWKDIKAKLSGTDIACP